MSLGGRTIRRGRTALSASICQSPAPREPLIFLYPQWAKRAATTFQGLDIDDVPEPPFSGSDHISSDLHGPQPSPGNGNAAYKALDHRTALQKDESAFRAPGSPGSFFRRILTS